MAQKLPKLFNPRFSDKDFNKKILKKIFIPKARDLVLKIYAQDADKGWSLRPPYSESPLNIDKKELKALEILAKEIAKNQGIFDFSKLILVGLVAAGLVVFVTFFLDGLVRRWTVDALQAIFGARVDIGSMYVRPWEGKVYFSDLAIADRESPMKNLVEFKDAQVDVDVGLLLSGSVRLNRIVAREMQFGTDRTYSGRLGWLDGHIPVLASLGPQPGEEAAEQGFDPGALFEAPLDQLPFANLLNLTRKSPKELLEAELSKLEASALIADINTKVRERQNFWQAQATESQNRIRQLESQVNSLTRRDVRQIRDLNELRSFLEQIKKTTDEVKALETTVRQSVDGIRSDVDQVARWRTEIPAAIEKDWNYLKSLVSLPPGGPVGWVSALIMPEVNRRFGSQIRLAHRVWRIAQAVKLSSEKKDVPPKPERRGQDIPFPTARYPKFYLGQLEVSLGSRANRDLFEFLLKDISSEPDLVNRPYLLSFTRLNQDKELNITALADLRTKAEAPFTARTLIGNEPFALPDALSAIGIQNFEGVATWKAEVQFLSQNGFRLAVETNIQKPILSWKESNEVTQLVDRILVSAGGIEANLELTARDQNREIQARTNLDEPARREIERWAREKIAQFEARLRQELDSRLAAVLNENRGLVRGFDSLASSINRSPAQVEEFNKSLREKQKEVEDRIANWARDNIPQNLPPVRLPF